mgnify:CR=1 FL=1
MILARLVGTGVSTQERPQVRGRELVSVHVIPRPHENIDLVLPLGRTPATSSK